jgi:hypothetical protein
MAQASAGKGSSAKATRGGMRPNVEGRVHGAMASTFLQAMMSMTGKM